MGSEARLADTSEGARPLAGHWPKVEGEQCGPPLPSAKLGNDSAHGRVPLGLLDFGRVLASFAVIWVHASEVQGLSLGASALGRFGTSFYIILSVGFSLISGKGARDRAEGRRKKTSKLLVPFLVWSGIYAVAYAFDAYRLDNLSPELAKWWGPFAGTARHLWFLPFAWCMSLLVERLAPRLRAVSAARFWVYAPLASFAAYLICYRYLFFAFPRLILIDLHLHRLDRWVEEFPLVVLVTGLVLGFEKLPARADKYLRQMWWLVAALAITLFLAVENAYYLNFDRWREITSTEGRYAGHVAALGLALTCVAFSQRFRIRSLPWLGRATYFAFLVHVLALDFLGPHLAGLTGFGSPWFAVLTSAGLLASGVLMFLLIARMRGAAYLAP